MNSRIKIKSKPICRIDGSICSPHYAVELNVSNGAYMALQSKNDSSADKIFITELSRQIELIPEYDKLVEIWDDFENAEIGETWGHVERLRAQFNLIKDKLA